MSGTTKWDDAAVKDLTMAILMSANNGSVNIPANWDKVQVALFSATEPYITRWKNCKNLTPDSTETMASWGYGFTKSAMNQHWSKKVIKQFKERHGDVKGGDDGDASPKTPKAVARKRANPKTPGAGPGKKRVADDGDDTSPEAGPIVDPIARNRTPRSVAKKVKYEAEEECAEAKAEAMGMNQDMVELEEEMEAAADKKAQKEDMDFYAF